MRRKYGRLVLFVFGFLAAFGVVLTQAGNNPVIDSPQALQAAIRSASSGEVLHLAGVDFGRMQINGAKNITLTSADPAKPAVFGGLLIKGAKGLVLDGLHFDYTFTDEDVKIALNRLNWPYQVLNSQGVTIRNSLFDGDILTKGKPLEVGLPTGSGLVVRKSADFTLENSEIRGFLRGIGVDHTRNTIIRNNNIHDLRMDGMNLVALDGVLVEGNYVHDFQRSLPTGDHSDMIQFWTNQTKVPSKDIVIRGNILNSGNGLYTQTIFMRNEAVDSKAAGREMYYRNILIENNVIINAQLHGISVSEAIGVTVRNNTLIHNRLSDGPENNVLLWIPQINIKRNAEDVTITNNIAHGLKLDKLPPEWKVSGNLAIQDRNPGQPGHYDQVFLNAIGADPHELENFAYRADGPAGSGKVGSPLLTLQAVGEAKASMTAPRGILDLSAVAPVKAEPVVVTSVAAPKAQAPLMMEPLITATQDATLLNRFTLDGSKSLLPEGMGAVVFEWQVGNSIVTGQQVQLDFKKPGPQGVTLTLRAENGQSATARIELAIPSLDILRFDGASGLLTSFSAKGSAEVSGLPLVALPEGGKAIQLGAQPVALPPENIAGLFSSEVFNLSLRLRVDGKGPTSGEVLRIHQTLILGVSPIGAAILTWTEPGKPPRTLRTGPLGLHDGTWHDLDLKFDRKAGLLSLWVDGAMKAKLAVAAPVGPMKSWGLSFGNGFGQTSLSGQIASLHLRGDEALFAR